MRKILSYDEYKLQEALAISVAKEYTKMWNPKTHKKVFGKSYRLYFPLYSEKGYDKKEIQNIEILEAQKSKTQEAVEQFLESRGYVVDNYALGRCSKENDKREFKIGKIINKEGDKKLFDEYNLDLEKQKKTSKLKDSNILVVISRHPYDIAGMSTDREWSSCMNLTDGSFNYHVKSDVKKGSMIAYLIKNDDLNINNPLGRILIKKFVNEKTKDEIYLTDGKIYGKKANINGFRETVDAWLDSWQPDKNGIYYMAKDLYDDGKNRVEIHKDGTETEYWDAGKKKPRHIVTYKNNKRDGEEKKFHPNGNLEMERTWEEGNRVGYEKEHFENGNLMSVKFFKNGDLEGERKEYYFFPKDQLSKLDTFKNGMYNGPRKRWYKNGQIWEDENYVNNNQVGLQRTYFEDGSLKSEVTYKESATLGSHDVRKNGDELAYWSPNILASKAFWKNGQKEGAWYEYYQDGTPEFEEHWKDGKKHGLFISYYENGNKEKEKEFKDGIKTGILKTYYDNGNIASEVPYNEHGQIDGVMKVYYENIKGQLEQEYQGLESNMGSGSIRPVGFSKEYFENGKISIECNYNKYGHKDGIEKSYNKDSGYVYHEAEYKDGVLDGDMKFYYGGNGKLYKICHYKDGKNYKNTNYNKNGDVIKYGKDKDK